MFIWQYFFVLFWGKNILNDCPFVILFQSYIIDLIELGLSIFYSIFLIYLKTKLLTYVYFEIKSQKILFFLSLAFAIYKPNCNFFFIFVFLLFFRWLLFVVLSFFIWLYVQYVLGGVAIALEGYHLFYEFYLLVVYYLRNKKLQNTIFTVGTRIQGDLRHPKQ